MAKVVRALPWDVRNEIEIDYTRPFQLAKLEFANSVQLVSTGPMVVLENQCAYSEQLHRNGPWTRSAVTVTANAALSPGDTLSMTKVIATSANSAHYLNQNLAGLADNARETVGLFVREGDYTYCRVGFVDKAGGVSYAALNFSTGAVTLTLAAGQVGGLAEAEDLGDGLWLVRLRNMDVRSGGTTPALRGYVTDDSNTITFAGSGVEGTYFWGGHAYAGSDRQTYLTTQASAYAREVYTAGALGVGQQQWDADGNQSVQIELFNENSSAVAVVLNNGVDGVPVTLYQCYLRADLNVTTPVKLVVGELTDSDITPTSAIVTVVTTQAGVEYLPNRYVTRAEGFNWLPPDGAQVVWGKETYLFERE